MAQGRSTERPKHITALVVAALTFYTTRHADLDVVSLLKGFQESSNKKSVGIDLVVYPQERIDVQALVLARPYR